MSIIMEMTMWREIYIQILREIFCQINEMKMRKYYYEN